VMAIKTVDHAFLLENADDRWLEHFEAETSLSSADLVQIARRATLLAIKNDAPVWTTVVLLSRRHAPANLPDCVVEERGSIAVTARPRFIRLWEVHPEPVLAEIPIEALPIIGGMRATRAQLGEAMQRLTEVRDRELRSRLFSELATWASLNYNEIEINEIRARSRMTFEELFLMSPFSEMLLKEAQEKAQREGLREGRQEGRQEGLQEGQIEGARSSLLSLADIRFPGLITSNRLRISTRSAASFARWQSPPTVMPQTPRCRNCALPTARPAWPKPSAAAWRSRCPPTPAESRLPAAMFWTVRGANAILALRCSHLNGRFEDYWANRKAA